MTSTLLPPFRRPLAYSGVRTPKRPKPAAGILLRHHDAHGYWYLLGLRAEILGGTWANFGGSLDPGETPLVGALRELEEETLLTYADLPEARLVATLDTTASPTRPYTLFVIDVAEPVLADLDWENDDAAWFHSSGLTTEPNLHRGLTAVVDDILRLERHTVARGAH